MSLRCRIRKLEEKQNKNMNTDIPQTTRTARLIKVYRIYDGSTNYNMKPY